MSHEITNLSKSAKGREIPECVGRNIRRLRKLHRLTLAQLSSKVDVSASYLNRIEKGLRRNVGYPILCSIATALGTDFATLFKDDGEKKPQPAVDDNTLPDHKQFIVWAMKGTIESENLTSSEKLDQLKIIADISRFLISPIQAH
jgi:transcriptional regulator with XRE-family HTH domain